MREMSVMLLGGDGKVKWVRVPWGRDGLNYCRTQGEILFVVTE